MTLVLTKWDLGLMNHVKLLTRKRAYFMINHHLKYKKIVTTSVTW